MWKPVLLMFVAMSCIPAGDAFGKMLTNDYGTSSLFVAWTRFVIGACLILPFIPRGSFAILTDWRILFRGLLIAGGISCILTSLRTAPLADVFAAFFIGPSVSYLLAVLFLKEPWSWARASFVALGFVGTLIVVRPGGGAAPGLEWAILAGIFYGTFLTTSRWLSHVAPPRALLFSQMVVGAVATAPLAVFALPPVTLPVAALSFGSGFFSMLGNLLLILVYRMAPATVVAPLVYFQLVAATLLGWIVFNTLPDTWTWAGLGIIVAAGVASTLVGQRRGS